MAFLYEHFICTVVSVIVLNFLILYVMLGVRRFHKKQMWVKLCFNVYSIGVNERFKARQSR